MEVAVTVEVEDLDQEAEPKLALSAYFTMVALDRNGRPQAVLALKLDNEEVRRPFEGGKNRYETYRRVSVR